MERLYIQQVECNDVGGSPAGNDSGVGGAEVQKNESVTPLYDFNEPMPQESGDPLPVEQSNIHQFVGVDIRGGSGNRRNLEEQAGDLPTGDWSEVPATGDFNPNASLDAATNLIPDYYTKEKKVAHESAFRMDFNTALAEGQKLDADLDHMRHTVAIEVPSPRIIISAPTSFPYIEADTNGDTSAREVKETFTSALIRDRIQQFGDKEKVLSADIATILHLSASGGMHISVAQLKQIEREISEKRTRGENPFNSPFIQWLSQYVRYNPHDLESQRNLNEQTINVIQNLHPETIHLLANHRMKEFTQRAPIVAEKVARASGMFRDLLASEGRKFGVKPERIGTVKVYIHDGLRFPSQYAYQPEDEAVTIGTANPVITSDYGDTTVRHEIGHALQGTFKEFDSAEDRRGKPVKTGLIIDKGTNYVLNEAVNAAYAEAWPELLAGKNGSVSFDDIIYNLAHRDGKITPAPIYAKVLDEVCGGKIEEFYNLLSLAHMRNRLGYIHVKRMLQDTQSPVSKYSQASLSYDPTRGFYLS